MNRIKELRSAKKLNQKEFAEIIGIAQPTLSGWETGRTQIDYANLNKLADYFNVSLDYLLGRDSNNISGLGLIPLSPENKKIPIIGSVCCGPNGLACQYIDGYMFVGDEYKGDIVAFKCKGDSMKDIGITDGDLAIVRLQEDVECGELAVVVINGDEGTLKRLRKFENGIILESANQEYPPRIFVGESLKTVTIVGKVLEVRKKF